MRLLSSRRPGWSNTEIDIGESTRGQSSYQKFGPSGNTNNNTETHYNNIKPSNIWIQSMILLPFYMFIFT